LMSGNACRKAWKKCLTAASPMTRAPSADGKP
jgi:hypothetical protein